MANYPEGYKAKFVLYNDKYPQVYAGIVRRARELRRVALPTSGALLPGRLRYSSEAPRPGVETRFLYADSMQEAINAGLNVSARSSLPSRWRNTRRKPSRAASTVRVHDHTGKAWYVTATTKEPEVIE